MAAKSLFVVCASVCLFNVVSAQYLGGLNNIAAEELALNGLRAPFGYRGSPYGNPGLELSPSTGGGFTVQSFSPIAPTGVSVISENAIEGPLSINGQLPFLGAITLEGALPSAGAGAINYGCGNGAIGIVSENLAPVNPGYPTAPGYGAQQALYGGYPGLAGPRAYNGVY